MNKVNILIVCTGNTCRSPMAEGILKSMLSEDDDIEVLSGGIFAFEGERVSENASLALKEKGIDILSHRAQSINASVIKDADLILTMTSAHKNTLVGLFGDDIKNKVYTLCEYAGICGDIDDPYGGDIDCYRRCADRLYSVMQIVYKKLMEQ